MSDISPQIEKLLSDLKLVFSGNPWYGHGVLEKLDQLSSEQATTIASEVDRSVSQVVAHMTAWRNYAISRVAGDNISKITLNSPIDWPSTDETKDWTAMLNALKTSQSRLIQLLSAKSDQFLTSRVPDEPYDFAFLLDGIVRHDVYHLGQIGTILRLVSQKAS